MTVKNKVLLSEEDLIAIFTNLFDVESLKLVPYHSDYTGDHAYVEIECKKESIDKMIKAKGDYD